MIQATMTSKGQVTIPKEIRDRLNLQSGDRLTFIIDRQGRITLTAQTIDVSELFDLITVKKRLTGADIKKAAAKSAVRRFLRASH